MRHARNAIVGSLGIAIALAMIASGPAEARRGGSFGSRGARTYSAPPSTSITPGYGSPIQRSMTAPAAAAGQPFVAPQRPRFGLPGGLVGGLLAGGLIGGLMGHGFGGGYGGGGGGGGLALIFQLAVIGLIIWAAMKFFRRRNPAFAQPGQGQSSFLGAAPSFAAGPAPFPGTEAYPAPPSGVAINVSASDQQAFERLLIELQDAFGKEDYGRLRAITTPEVMSYLAEEMSQNAVQGRRNDVSGVRLLRAEVSEAWAEGDVRYVTVAMHYESIDVMRDRTTGALLQGAALTPTQTTEVWTFLQRPGSPWLVSAIQET